MPSDFGRLETKNTGFLPVLQPESIYRSMVTKATYTSDINAVIDNAIRTVEEEHKQPNNILPKNFSSRAGQSHPARKVVGLFRYQNNGNIKDIMNCTYEYCLSKFTE